jgi:hypothetical protein
MLPQIFGILGILITSVSEIIPLICAICGSNKNIFRSAHRGAETASAEGASPNSEGRKPWIYRRYLGCEV